MNGLIRKYGAILPVLLSAIALLAFRQATGAPMTYTPVPSWTTPASTPPNSIVLRQDPASGLLLVSAWINGKPCTLIVDTGTTHTVFDTQFIQRNFPGSPRSPICLQPGSNVISSPEAFAVGTLRLGESVQRSFFAVVMDISSLRSALGAPVDGILGMNSLGIAPFVISASQGRLQWFHGSTPHPDGFLPIPCRKNSLGGITISGNTGTRELDFLIDSGATFTSVPASCWPNGPTSLVIQETADINSRISRTETRRRGTPLNICFGNALTLPGVEPVLTENAIPCILGLDMLRQFDMLIDMRRGTIRIRPAPYAQKDHP